MPARALVALIVVGFLAGCGIPSRIQGEYYLGETKYSDCEAAFRQSLQRDPYDAAANFYMGRCLLALDRPREALKFLKEAVALGFHDADHHYWLGICYHAMQQPKMERASYRQALEVDPQHLNARLDLGNSYLDSGGWKEALACYEAVLARDPRQPQALYNRGLAFGKLRRPAAEIEAWKAYLDAYSEGKWAIRAVDHLNALDDFAWRNYVVGQHRIPLERIGFDGAGVALSPAAMRSLDKIGSVLGIDANIHLQIVAHEKGSAALAKRRAARIRDYLINNQPTLDPQRLSIKAVAEPERVKGGKKHLYLASSINIVTLKK